ncbi:TPR 11 domain containing protein [Asbolus verrucosus]|uniref:TPR 11 domain containing protein n=1 Tax=Asbolus verrucosus TaxID=1661398 RepID=A0A482VN96_ASBVE|nr:TPR 11 domain containing protein [Asbolus verrucosus]
MGSIHTKLRIVNNTNTDIINTSVWGVDNYDWDGDSRPDHNFSGVFIGSKSSEERREEVNKSANHCPFTISLQFRNGTVDTFRIHQRHAIGCCAGFQHIRRSHNIYYNTSEGNVLTVTIENTEQQLQNERAEQLKKEGEAEMKQKQYEAAVKKYNEALRLANESQTINSLMANKAAAYNEQGKFSLQKGWDLENDATEDKSQEARNQFRQAQLMFQQAENLRHTSEYEDNLRITNIKIEGNSLYNEANDLEKEAFKLFQEAKKSNIFEDAQNKYKEALNLYKAAKEKFDEGLKMNENKFDVCSKIANKQIEEVLKVIVNIKNVELVYNFKKLNVKNQEEKNGGNIERPNTNVQKQV